MRAREALARALRAAASRVPDLFAVDAPLIVGYSGGQDSTALLHALSRHRPRGGLIAVHVDHALRAGSADTALQVVAAGAAMGIAVEISRVDVPAYRHRLTGWSVQQAARAARYHALAQAAQERGAVAVLVAHTADDQAETLLLHLLRGAGLAGLAGMRLEQTLDAGQLGPPPAEWDVGPAPLRLARPLLGVRRSTTLAYCAELGLPVVEDPSNQSRAYTRNRVRLDLLPALEAFNPAIGAVLARTADLAADDLAVLEAVVAELARTLARPAPPGELVFDLAQWRLQPRALQRRLLRRGLAELLGTLADVPASPIEDALDLLSTGRPTATYHLPYGVEVRIESDVFRLLKHGRAMQPQRSRKIGGVERPRV
ncbi:MAG TPA: tRNA lysidine(34) synthetase TilS [Chloroflexota bacterium]|nr:tRNA lysidine(34) synthetase TilS [Chloroflexota bacterium]